VTTPHTLIPAVPPTDIPLAFGGSARIMICRRCEHVLLDPAAAPVTPKMRREHLHLWGYDVLDCDDCIRARAQGLWAKRLSPGGSA
jgi:hypothetical protein